MSEKSIPFEPWRAWWSSTDFTTALLAGAVAGFACDTTLYPLDTIKTRLQAPSGFAKSGGFKGSYRGVTVALAGSVPCSALFFGCFEAAVPLANAQFERTLRANGLDGNDYPELRHCVTNAVAAALGEFVTATIRTPLEAVKQRRQVGKPVEANLRALWRGWGATVLRDVPFSTIQYPLYHSLKRRVKSSSDQKDIEPWKAALCGSLSSAFAALLTTPFDVAQTRVILAETAAERAKSPLQHLQHLVAGRARA
mmetsp:Transcript_11350/g.40189  ORF Transcript_11350/g.40189 Transcript_11350/m.40189 type:complete len:253 (-) Transcript_11350:398-1156(-)